MQIYLFVYPIPIFELLFYTNPWSTFLFSGVGATLFSPVRHASIAKLTPLARAIIYLFFGFFLSMWNLVGGYRWTEVSSDQPVGVKSSCGALLFRSSKETWPSILVNNPNRNAVNKQKRQIDIRCHPTRSIINQATTCNQSSFHRTLASELNG